MIDACFHDEVWYEQRDPDPAVVDALRRLGAQLRMGRWNVGYSQRRLEGRTGIDQSTISRLENGLAPGIALERVAAYLVGIHADVAIKTRPLSPLMREPASPAPGEPTTSSGKRQGQP